MISALLSLSLSITHCLSFSHCSSVRLNICPGMLCVCVWIGISCDFSNPVDWHHTRYHGHVCTLDYSWVFYSIQDSGVTLKWNTSLLQSWWGLNVLMWLSRDGWSEHGRTRARVERVYCTTDGCTGVFETFDSICVSLSADSSDALVMRLQYFSSKGIVGCTPCMPAIPPFLINPPLNISSLVASVLPVP